MAAPYACSGLTVYSALKKAQPIADDEWLVIMGAGGVGLIAVIDQAMGIANVLSYDIDPAKLSGQGGGASATLNTADGNAAAALLTAVEAHRRWPFWTRSARKRRRAASAPVKGGRIVGLWLGASQHPLRASRSLVLHRKSAGA